MRDARRTGQSSTPPTRNPNASPSARFRAGFWLGLRWAEHRKRWLVAIIIGAWLIGLVSRMTLQHQGRGEAAAALERESSSRR
jgi:hypothetical protein